MSVIVYSKEGCGPCGRAKALLTALGVPYDDRDIYDDVDHAIAFDELPGSPKTVPQILVHGELIGGSDALHAWAGVPENRDRLQAIGACGAGSCAIH